MELDDSFTEKINQKLKSRKEYLLKMKIETQQLVGKKRGVLVEDKQFAENQDAKNTAIEDSPKRQCLQVVANDEMDDKENISDTEVEPFVPICTAANTRGLAALRKQDTNWNDAPEDMDYKKSQEIQGAENSVNTTEENDIESDDDLEMEQDGHDDKSEMKTGGIIQKVEIADNEPHSYGENKDPAELPLSARKAMFEKALFGQSSKQNDAFEPKMSVAQRAALFENASKGNVKAPVTKTQSRPGSEQPVNIVAKGILKNVFERPVQNTTSEYAIGGALKGKSSSSSSAKSTPSPTKNVGAHTRQIQQQLLESTGDNWMQKDIVVKATSERKQEISGLVNHWEKLSSSNRDNASPERTVIPAANISPPRLSEDSEYYQEDVFSDEESNSEIASEIEKDEGSSSCNSSSISQDSHDSSVSTPFSDVSTNASSIVSCNSKIASCSSNASTSSRGTNPSVSEATLQNAYRTPNIANQLPTNAPVRSHCEGDHTTPIMDRPMVKTSDSKNPDVPLLYTVSFYRKQKQETRGTPVRTVVRRETVKSPPSPEMDKMSIIQERMVSLQDEVLRQQTVIGQTSQALNLCQATAEFSGSVEQVEGERLLLIATQKRQACLNEIQRLKAHGVHGGDLVDGTGTLTITNIQLPLKREFMVAKAEGRQNDIIHHFLCLIRHGHQVIVTQMMSTDDKINDGVLSFTNHITLQNLPADFSVAFEVYALQTKKEVLPHEKKYHIKRESSKIRLTPKTKRLDNKTLLPVVTSPGGPNAVRSPSFGVIGFTRFTLQNCNKRCFTLDKVPFSSPLDGVLRVKLQLHSEHKVNEKGFLTMFEDVSGFGAWHRRWCALNSQCLAYWKYPDDEHKKEPIGVLELKQCVTGQVRLVSRDACARPHTFQLVTVRPHAQGDKNTLISRSVNTITTTKHFLSADTKEERILWCNKLNEALTSIRKWDPEALRPIE